MKTLEASLSIKLGSEKHTISSRVAELDEEVPIKLGASKVVLENVIFCHQDESLWPMSEPAALKKKFDEIFEVTKYSNAIQNLAHVHKKQSLALKDAKTMEEVNKAAKERGERVRKQRDELQIQIDDLKVECAELNEKITQAQQQHKQKTEEANSFLSIVNDLQNKKQQYGYKTENAADLQRGLEEMPESDASLQDSLDQYEGETQRLRADILQRTTQFKELSADIAASRKALGAKHAEQGRLQSDKDKHERRLETRADMVRAASERLEIRGYDGDLNDSQIRAFQQRIEKIVADKRLQLERLKDENSAEHDRASMAISELETQKATRTQDRVFARQRVDVNEKKAMMLQNDIKMLAVDEGDVALLESKFTELEGRLQKAAQDFNATTIDKELQQLNETLWQQESESEKLNQELVECTRLASDRAELDLRKKELAERKRNLETLTNTWNDALAAKLGAAWQAESVDSDFRQVLKQLLSAAADAKTHVAETQQKLKETEYKLSTLRESEKRLTSDSARTKAAVLKALETVKPSESAASVDDYQAELDNTEEDLLDAEKESSLFDHMKDYYTKCQTMLNKHNKCLLCERTLAEQPVERTRLSQKIARQLNDTAKKEIEKEKDELEAKLGRLRAVRSQYDSHRRVESELPSVREQISTMLSQKDAIVRELEKHDAAYKKADEERQDTELMQKTVSDISHAFKAVGDSDKEIARLASQHPAGGPGRSPDEIQELQAACAEQLKAVKHKLNKLSTDKQRMKDRVGSLELEKSELKNKMDRAARQNARKRDLAEQVQSLKSENSSYRERIQQADGDLEGLEPRIAKARAMREEAVQRHRAREQAATGERDAVVHTVTELRMIEQDIREYLDGGRPEKLAASELAIQELDGTIADLERESGSLTSEVNGLRARIENGDRRKKNMQDNLNFRKMQRDLGTLEAEIAELESRNASEDHSRLAGEARAWEDERHKLSALLGTKMGVINSKDEEFGRRHEEFEKDYKNADLDYRKSRIQVSTTQAAIDDIARYQRALEKAVMQYHSLKMEEVNRVAGELWQATYQGTDIDTILIRSDPESSTASVTRRSYNYRVCMVKQDAEMDMRGRCSAGQKVLASIIIRLALAESFGVNCGLVALDEPTTNLDVDNIRSLAASLHGIIKARQAQANFQLIVITHDEEFLRHMQCSDFCDTFYRVKRDNQQNSVITKESITRLIDS